MTQDYLEQRVNSLLENKYVLERVSELVETRLIECGWKDQVRLACRKLLEDNDRISSVDELIAAMTPKARSLVPDLVKRELFHELELIITKADKV